MLKQAQMSYNPSFSIERLAWKLHPTSEKEAFMKFYALNLTKNKVISQNVEQILTANG